MNNQSIDNQQPHHINNVAPAHGHVDRGGQDLPTLPPSAALVHRIASHIFPANALGEAMTECVVQTTARVGSLANRIAERTPLVRRWLLEARLDAWVADPSCTGDKMEAKRRILTAFQNNSTTLDLSGLHLTTAPSAIGQLTQLRELSLHHNQLTTLPSTIGQLSQLWQLWLHHNRLTSLPPEIGQLVRLLDLDLDHNQLTFLPTEIGQLVRLLTLPLRHNQLTTLPSTIGQLSQLWQLWFAHNQLTSLPPEIGRLTRLWSLDLSNNQLTSLPPEIGQLTQLQEIYLTHNQLTSLPPEIGQLTRLNGLMIHDNPELAELPMTLGHIPGLTHLSIEGTNVRPEMRIAILASTEQLRRREATASLPNKLRLWQVASREDFDLSSVEQFNDDEKGTLNEWLTRLERARDFRGNAQAIMARAVCEILVEATTNTAFKEALLAQAEANNENCQDRASMALNELYTSLKLTQLDADAPLEEQFAILTRAAKTFALRSAVARQIATRQLQTGEVVREAVEVYLFCETRLKIRLNLLSIISTMSYERLGNVDWISLDALVEEVLRTHLDHLFTLSAFEKLAESGEYRRGHEAEYATFHERLETMNPNLTDQELFALSQEIYQEQKALDLHHKKEWARSLLAE